MNRFFIILALFAGSTQAQSLANDPIHFHCYKSEPLGEIHSGKITTQSGKIKTVALFNANGNQVVADKNPLFSAVIAIRSRCTRDRTGGMTCSKPVNVRQFTSFQNQQIESVFLLDQFKKIEVELSAHPGVRIQITETNCSI